MRASRAVFALLTLFTSRWARAQESAQNEVVVSPTAPPPPFVTALQLGSFGVRAGDISGSAGDRRASVAIAPLRLSLTSNLMPMGRFFPGCDAGAEASGNSIQGFPVARSSFLRLPSGLTLHGFSSGGCALDASVGGGATYQVAFGPAFSVVVSAGVLVLPDVAGLRQKEIASEVGVDVVTERKSGNSMWMGLGVGSRAPGGNILRFRFGGTF